MRYIQQAVLGFLVSLPVFPSQTELSANGPSLIDLRSSAHFVILSGTAITSTGGGTIRGDVGASPITGAAITSLNTAQVRGLIYTVDNTGPAGSVMHPTLLTEAKFDLAAAYNDAEGRTSAALVAGGMLAGTREPGLYKDDGTPASLGLTGTLILDALGDSDSVWIFQSSSTLITEAECRIVLTNGAAADRVFWQVGSSATVKTGAEFKGTIMALSSISIDSGASLEGRALSLNAAVTFNGASASLPPPDEPVFTDIYRATNDATVIELTTTPFYLLSQQSIASLTETNWTTIVVSTPESSPWTYTDETASPAVTLHFYRAYITYFHL